MSFCIKSQHLISGSSDKGTRRGKTQFELEFDLPNEAPVAHSIKSQQNEILPQFPTLRSNTVGKPQFDPESALKELNDYEDSTQFKMNEKRIPTRGSNFRVSDLGNIDSELSKLRG
uniref:Uncharacterized protein n=1 Tax=Parastrongyloides trichosuri TaxID=131310 RepID=A0A0N4ZC94_PARTI